MLPYTLLFGILISALLAPLSAARPISLAGSDLLADVLAPLLQEYQESSEATWEYALRGSIPALKALESGEAEIAIIAIPPQDPLPEDAYTLIPFAYQAAFVLVNRNNPVAELSLPQLQGIFTQNPGERLERWGQLGLEGILTSRSIQAFLANPDNSVLVELFKSEALDGKSLRNTATLVSNNLELYNMVSTDAGVIGISDRPPNGSEARPVPISSGERGSYAFGPTPENIYYADYPLRLPFYIAIPRQADPQDYGRLIAFLLSDEVATALAKNGFIPLPQNIRKRTLLELDMGE